MLFRENLQEVSTKGFQITIILPMKCIWGDSVLLVIWLFTLQCPAVRRPFIAPDVTKMGKVCELDACDKMMIAKTKVICM